MKSIIILCGGKSRRMGKDKGSLILNEKPMILHTIDSVKEFADEIIVVLRDKNQVKDYNKILKNEKNVKIVTDLSKDQGPLIGIFTGLSHIKSDKAQVLPCDSPYISNKFIFRMFKVMEEFNMDAVAPKWEDGHIEPLHSIYKKNNLNKIKELIKSGERDVNSLINSINVKFIDVNEVDSTLRTFKNLNTLTDLEVNK